MSIIPFCFMPYIRPLLSFAFKNATLAATCLENTSSLAVDGASLVAPSGKEPSCQCRRCWRHGFNPWVGRILEGDMTTHSVSLPGKSHGQRSLEGYSSWDHKESDMTKWLSTNAGYRYPHSDGFHGWPSAFSLPERMGKVTASKPFSPTACPPGLPLDKNIIHGMQWHKFSLDVMKLKLRKESQRFSEMTQEWNGGKGKRSLQRDRR